MQSSRASPTNFGLFVVLFVFACFIPSGYQAGAMLNGGKVVFRAEVSVQDNTAVMDGGGFINE